MKIIDVAEFYTDQGGGVKTYINQKLRAGAQMGHEVVIVAPGRQSGEEERYGGRVIWVPGPPLPVDPRYTILWREQEVHRILDREKPDVVEGSSPWTGGWFAGRWKGDAVKSFIFHQDPVAVYPHTMLDGWFSHSKIDRMFGFYWHYLRRLSRKFDATIVSGEWLNKRLNQFRIQNPVTVPFGIDKAFFSPERRDPELRKSLLDELGLPEDASLLMGISRFHPEKRLGTMIQGFRKAREQRPMGMLLYGDGPFRRWVKRQTDGVGNLKLKGFTSNRDELANILASCDYFVHGSAAETYGLVVAEAICSGLPVVVPAQGGAAELADDSYGAFYQPGDANDLAEKLVTVTGQDRGQASRACITDGVPKIDTMDDHFRNLFQVYEELLNGKSPNEVITD